VGVERGGQFPDNPAEAEFSEWRRALYGAVVSLREGKFQLANGGNAVSRPKSATMPLPLQAKLLASLAGMGGGEKVRASGFPTR